MTPARIVGREPERAALLETLEEDGPLVAFVHGPAGIGKSALLEHFRAGASASGACVLRLDCRAFEPTERGFVDALAREAGASITSAADAARALTELGDRVIVTIDTYESFRISDTWLRSDFAPTLSPQVRLVIAGREPPLTGWFNARGPRTAFRSLRLGPLEDDAALEVLRDAGMSEDDARAVNKVTRGHPLALQVAGVALLEQPGITVDESAVPRVVEELTRLYLDDVDTATRRLLDAASVVRRVTASLMSAMLPGENIADALDRIASLPFVDEAPDGLRLHEAVQAAIVTRLRARDPEAYRRYGAAAWRALRAEVGQATRAELWRYTADILYLLQNPAVREAFFPTTQHLFGVEPAVSDDGDAIREIVARHEPAASAAVIDAWWAHRPSAFRVVRDRSDAVVGLLIVSEAETVPYTLVQADPVVAAWREHLARHPLPAGQRALFDRLELSRVHGGAPSPVQASTWLDIKRIYMEMRPHLGRLYSVSADPAPYAEALATLGFSFFPAPVSLGRDYHLAWLDFGPDSVDGWLARLAAAELGVRPTELLDEAAHELVLGDERTPLTPLEFGVLKALLDRKGNAVTRAALLEQVWGHKDPIGSNVVDVVVRALRKKLGARATDLETVRGVGYRFKA